MGLKDASKKQEGNYMEQRVRMPYSQYKAHYSDCKTVPKSYDKWARSIMITIPEGRMKPSGVRGKSFRTYFFYIRHEGSDKPGSSSFRAVSLENARKQAVKAFGDKNVLECYKVF